MKKISLLVVALAAVAVLGASAYAAGKPAPKAAPAKKIEVKLMTVQGVIAAIDAKSGTFSLAGEGAAAGTTFKVSAKLAKALKVGENVTVGYKTGTSGENEAVYVKKEAAKKVKKARKEAAVKK